MAYFLDFPQKSSPGRRKLWRFSLMYCALLLAASTGCYLGPETFVTEPFVEAEEFLDKGSHAYYPRFKVTLHRGELPVSHRFTVFEGREEPFLLRLKIGSSATTMFGYEDLKGFVRSKASDCNFRVSLRSVSDGDSPEPTHLRLDQFIVSGSEEEGFLYHLSLKGLVLRPGDLRLDINGDVGRVSGCRVFVTAELAAGGRDSL